MKAAAAAVGRGYISPCADGAKLHICIKFNLLAYNVAILLQLFFATHSPCSNSDRLIFYACFIVYFLFLLYFYSNHVCDICQRTLLYL